MVPSSIIRVSGSSAISSGGLNGNSAAAVAVSLVAAAGAVLPRIVSGQVPSEMEDVEAVAR